MIGKEVATRQLKTADEAATNANDRDQSSPALHKRPSCDKCAAKADPEALEVERLVADRIRTRATFIMVLRPGVPKMPYAALIGSNANHPQNST